MTQKKLTRDQVWALACDGWSQEFIEQNAEELKESFAEFFTARKMINAMVQSVDGTINAPLIVNKFITLLNEFGKTKVTCIFRAICDDVSFSVAKAILMYLGKYDFQLVDHTYENRIMRDVLNDLDQRYDLRHI